MRELNREGETLTLQSEPGKNKRLVICAVMAALGIALMLALRLIALDSDAYERLSWSSALLTDEGFYLHNARNLILFGNTRTDDFNNMMIMPTLHFVQVAVFKVCGVGIVQSRMISVTLSILTIPVFFDSLRRGFGLREAIVGTIFFGLDHINILYNRLALMDTPAMALAVFTLYTLQLGTCSTRKEPSKGVKRNNASILWLICSGGLLGLTFITRGLYTCIIPLFMVAAWRMGVDRGQKTKLQTTAWFTAGLAGILSVWVVFWYMPNRIEIQHLNHYYFTELFLPHNFRQLGHNILSGLFDFQRGIMPYLLRHSPIQFGLAIVGIGWQVNRQWFAKKSDLEPNEQFRNDASSELFSMLAWWLIIFLVILLVSDYSPSRYYVLFYPAMSAIAAVTCFRMIPIGRELLQSKILVAPMSSFLMCLAIQSVRAHIELIRPEVMPPLFIGVVIAIYIGMLLQTEKQRNRMLIQRWDAREKSEIWIACLSLWAIVNVYWTGDWLQHISYRQRNIDRELTAILPPNSVLLGDVAPALSINGRFKTINVINGLCNYSDPIENFNPPRYICTLDSVWHNSWWMEHYPALVTPEHRFRVFKRVLRTNFVITIYSVDSTPNSISDPDPE